MKKIIFLIIYSITYFHGYSQTPGRYRISFTDKNNSKYSLEKPSEFLSSKAISRRNTQKIEFSLQDLPVNSWYIDSVLYYGAKHCNTSKWFNSAIFIVDSTTNYNKIETLPFVKSIERVAPIFEAEKENAILQSEPLSPLEYSNITNTNPEEFYGKSYNQIALMNGIGLHKDGFMGQDMTIAVIDAGFLHADSVTAFSHIWKQNRFLYIKDFTGNNSDLFTEGYHGMAVLSLIGGFIPGKLVGTAPRANFMLLRTEEGKTEYRVEEDNWAAAAEFADSAGVDIISTSLGYSTFDDSTQNYVYEQLDGNTTRITIAADIAASKGILLCNSAGNSGDKAWKYITAPADADSVITVGACFANGTITSFSSLGPTAKGTIKPDVITLGYKPSVVRPNGLIKNESMGTSFSNPILAGMAACLWQEYPRVSSQQIKQAIIASSSLYYMPNNTEGYGIPNFEKARYILKMNLLETIFSNAKLYPNPFGNNLKLRVESESDAVIGITMYDTMGVKKLDITIEIPTLINEMDIPEVSNLAPGVYITVLSFGKQHQVNKLVKSE